MISPSKSFNLAGLCCGMVIIQDKKLRDKFEAAQVGIMAGVNVFGFAAAEAAYKYGEPWLKKQILYLRGNRDYLYKHLNTIPGIQMLHTEATYLAWVNVSALGLNDPEQYFEKFGVGVCGGDAFGDSNYIRINFGCCRSLLVSAVKRIRRAAYEATNKVAPFS